LKNFGYVGGVVKVDGKYYMYNEHPIDSTGADYGPLSVAFSDSPEGLWVGWEGNPAMLQGEWCEWDDGGISEAEVIYHIGVQVLVIQKPFSIEMPIINLDTLHANAVMTLNNTPQINLSNITRLAVSAQCRYSNKSTKGLVLHVLASSDGEDYDTIDLFSLELDLKRGKKVKRTFDLSTAARFIKVLVENPDKKEAVTDVKVIATLGG